ncbi:hypothetical protein SCHPADRAFT_895936 [Schizopora paradoxa]|uniref:Uncharacterized protein n=1 Tax=Schizopora paradoxa TaxID=27342 RepID=A0A0H2R8J8_9AGAM|nr:hypothetical protein SCHPADRAFT_895936 [Schizopora paradoxa]
MPLSERYSIGLLQQDRCQNLLRLTLKSMGACTSKTKPRMRCLLMALLRSTKPAKEGAERSGEIDARHQRGNNLPEAHSDSEAFRLNALTHRTQEKQTRHTEGMHDPELGSLLQVSTVEVTACSIRDCRISAKGNCVLIPEIQEQLKGSTRYPMWEGRIKGHARKSKRINKRFLCSRGPSAKAGLGVVPRVTDRSTSGKPK